MPEIPARHNRTVAAIFERHERDSDDWRRAHLGASLIGRECTRELWYSFRWVVAPNFEGRLLRLFERGQREEDWLAEELRAIGVDLHTHDENGNQYRVSFAGGHFGGSTDGVGLGFPEAPKTWHVFEAKTSNDKGFKLLQSKGVKEAKPEHYAQMQTYMHGLKLKRAFYACVNKNDDQIYTERIHYVEAEAQALILKAAVVIQSPEPLSKISEDPSWWKCKFCTHYPVCHLQQVDQIERNCRTCLESTPQSEDGSWKCSKHDKLLTLDEQKAGCQDHLFIPGLLPWEAVAVNQAERRITYKKPDGSLIVDHSGQLKGE